MYKPIAELDHSAHAPRTTEVPSSEGTFYFEEHTSYTGQASAKWRFYPAVGIEVSPNAFILANGHLGVLESYVPFAEAAALLGLNTIITGPPGGQKTSHAYHPEHLFHPERLAAQMLGRIARDAKERYKFPALDVGGHSKGVPAAVAAAVRWPNKFASVTAQAGAGMTGHGFWDLAGRVPRVGWDIVSERTDLQRNLGIRILGKTGAYVVRNPLRVFGETIAVTQSNVIPGLAKLGEFGVQRAAILCDNDGFFSADVTQELCAGVLDFVHHLEGLSHTAHQSNPEEVAAAQVDLLQAMRSRSARAS